MKIEPRSPLPSPKQAKPGKPKTPDEYLSALSDDQRGALEALRAAIRAAAPQAEECISYDRPAFRLNGKLLVAYGAAKNHCAFYAGSTIQSFVEELKNYSASKGTIRFPADKALPRQSVMTIGGLDHGHRRVASRRLGKRSRQLAHKIKLLRHISLVSMFSWL
jgi:uncharacterized protein YdhG (YjbR/CyaY superfamily)